MPLPRLSSSCSPTTCAISAKTDDALVFTTDTGEAIRRGTFRSRVSKPSLRRAGLPETLRFHDLRHSYATWLVSDGVPINEVAKVRGSEQTSTAFNRYTRTRPVHGTAASWGCSLPSRRLRSPAAITRQAKQYRTVRRRCVQYGAPPCSPSAPL
ncbi:MAG TPA: tyrosine-type recombinase/integrase [Micromonosporaceae bacterium]